MGQVRGALAFDDQPVGNDVVARWEPCPVPPVQLGGNAGAPFTVIEEQHAQQLPLTAAASTATLRAAHGRAR